MNPRDDNETGSDGMDRWFYGGTPPAEPDVDEAAHAPGDARADERPFPRRRSDESLHHRT